MLRRSPSPALLLHVIVSFFAFASLAYDNPEADVQPRHNGQSCYGASQEYPASRQYFYTGGQYIDDGTGGHIYADQMYVEQLSPSCKQGKKTPIVFIHGQAQTGTNFLNKPDGGVGWASRFLEQGHTVYIVDQTARARSAWAPGRAATSPSTYNAELIEARFTAVQSKSTSVWPQARLHTQWPGPGTMGDPIFDAYYSSNVQFISNATYQQKTVQDAGAALLDRIGEPVILVGHSQGGILPIVIGDARPKLVKALVLLEPTGPPFQDAIFSTGNTRRYGLTDIPITYSPAVTNPAIDLVKQVYPPPVPNTDNSTIPCILQAQSPPPRQLVNLAPMPILVMQSEASYHAPYDYCTVNYLRQAGCSKTDFYELAKMGINGNGHLFFMEKNSDQIQQLLEKWINKLG